MFKRFVSENIARLAIYILSSLALAGTLAFALSAHAYSAPEEAVSVPPIALAAVPPIQPVASAASEPQPAAVPADPPETAPTATLPLAPASDVTSGLPQAPPSADSDAGPANAADTAPDAVELPPIELGEDMPDADILEAELARLGATGVSLPDLIAPEYVGEYYATAYCCEVYPHICGGNGVTASGTVPTQGLTAAADWSVLPPGTWLYIEDVGIRRIEDSGSAIKKQRLDIAIDTHANALRWRGLGNHRVWVLAWA